MIRYVISLREANVGKRRLIDEFVEMHHCEDTGVFDPVSLYDDEFSISINDGSKGRFNGWITLNLTLKYESKTLYVPFIADALLEQYLSSPTLAKSALLSKDSLELIFS